MIKRTFLTAAAFLTFSIAFGQQYGGMWIPTELNEKEMKEMGMKISAKDIFNIQKPSIKDAVVQFNGGCTAEIISPKGLLLTNHHCGYDQIQSHSTVENDLLTNGFWATNPGEELPNPGVTVDFIVDIQDVSNFILKGTENLTGKELEDKITTNISTYKASKKTEDYQKIVIKPVYYGNKYYAYVIETFKDIRLVGAPPSAIGKFGSDTDNWVWPRHTGDFSMFRIYADKNNKPAEYSKDNIPFTPKYFLPVSLKDKKENDFTFIFGFPGRTQEYLPSIAIEKIVNETDPAMISVRDVALKTLNEKMRTDNATRIKYASKYARVANYWKKWQGEVEGLKKSGAIAKKREYEKSLATKTPDLASTLSQLERLYTAQAPYSLNRAYYGEVTRNSETLRLAGYYYNYINAAEKGKMTDDNEKRFKEMLTEFYKDYDAQLDAKVTSQLLALYAGVTKNPEFLPKNFKNNYGNESANFPKIENWSLNSIITGRATLNEATVYSDIDKVFADRSALISALKKDPFLALYTQLRDTYMNSTENQYQEEQIKIDALQKKYMAELMATDKDRKFFPDANSTLRVAYGKVQGSNPRDAVYYGYQTHLSGVMEKYIPGDYEFNVPQKLIQLYNTKDYGIYKDGSNDVPVNFTATNHTTGGNSGSPALDAEGNLIGLNFDRQWEGTMSDLNFDPKLCRNIMVDTKYILFIIDRYANAKWLLDEMKIVK